jgi:hypothetical protein
MTYIGVDVEMEPVHASVEMALSLPFPSLHGVFINSFFFMNATLPCWCAWAHCVRGGEERGEGCIQQVRRGRCARNSGPYEAGGAPTTSARRAQPKTDADVPLMVKETGVRVVKIID